MEFISVPLLFSDLVMSVEGTGTSIRAFSIQFLPANSGALKPRGGYADVMSDAM
jgi:hypothetical protein